MFRFSTRSDYDKIDRWVQERKFYATLPHKLDAAQDKWLKTQPESTPTVKFTEKLDGETLLGGEMRLSFKPKDNTTS